MPSQKERFVSNPVSLDISRSKFNLNHKHTTTFNAGQLVPILAYSDVLPGDTFKMDVSFVCRSTTPVAPTMDDAYIQVEFYFVPHKLVLSRAYMAPQTNDSNHSWAAIIGAQDSLLNMPLPDPDYNLPALQWNTNTDSAEYRKSVAHYLGYPSPGISNDPSDYSGVWDGYFNPLPMLAFYAVWNENYRDPNIMAPVVFSITASGVIQFAKNQYAGIGAGGASDNIFKHTLPVVCREHGYFGSALPWPQRNGTAVDLPLGELAPVVPMGTSTNDGDAALLFKIDGTPTTTAAQDLVLNTTAGNPAGSVASDNGSTDPLLANLVKGTNLFADLSEATAASVNMLRYAIQLQRLYEAWARGGNRIQDLTQIFGVTPHDMGDDRPEYLGGKRIPLNITQVNNTSGTTYSTATQQSIGSTGAFSNTSDVDHYFTKSFDTWGTIIGVCLVRHHDSFGMMFPKMLSRRNRLDFYWPQFANLGEQPVYVREMCFSDLNAGDDFLNSSLDFDEVFGYQEAYAEYRYIPDRISGEVDYSADGSLGYWVYNSDHGFDGVSRPLASFIDASLQADEIDATLQVDHLTAGFQYLAQFYFDITAVRPMPLYSIPGLMDHH